MERGRVCVCVSWPVTLCWSHMPWWGAQSAVKSTITVVCCVMTALGRLVTALANDGHGRPTLCLSVRVWVRVCVQTERQHLVQNIPSPPPHKPFSHTYSERLEESTRSINLDALLPPRVHKRRCLAVRWLSTVPTYWGHMWHWSDRPAEPVQQLSHQVQYWKKGAPANARNDYITVEHRSTLPHHWAASNNCVSSWWAKCVTHISLWRRQEEQEGVSR